MVSAIPLLWLVLVIVSRVIMVWVADIPYTATTIGTRTGAFTTSIPIMRPIFRLVGQSGMGGMSGIGSYGGVVAQGPWSGNVCILEVARIWVWCSLAALRITMNTSGRKRRVV